MHMNGKTQLDPSPLDLLFFIAINSPYYLQAKLIEFLDFSNPTVLERVLNFRFIYKIDFDMGTNVWMHQSCLEETTVPCSHHHPFKYEVHMHHL